MKEVLVMEYPVGRIEVVKRLEDGGLSLEPVKDAGRLSLLRAANTETLEYVWRKTDGSGTQKAEIIPAGSTLEKINSGKAEDRVYMLSHKTAQASPPANNEQSKTSEAGSKDATQANEPFRRFFWLQEQDVSKDAAFIENFQKYLKTPGLAAPVIDRTPLGSANSVDLMQRIMSSLSQDNNLVNPPYEEVYEPALGTTELYQRALQAPVRPSTNTAGAPPANQQAGLTPEAIRNAVAGLARARQRPVTVSLVDIVTSDAVLPVLDDPEVVATLLPLLPPELQNEQELKETVRNPQFKQALAALSDALQSDNLQMIFNQFGLNLTDATTYLSSGDGIGAFIAAIVALAKKSKDKTEDMDVETDEFYK